jgi:hypothetical protein
VTGESVNRYEKYGRYPEITVYFPDLSLWGREERGRKNDGEYDIIKKKKKILKRYKDRRSEKYSSHFEGESG